VVGLVIVSHSAELADGVVELAGQMGGGDVRIEAAGGLEDGTVGTDAARVQAAIERAMSADGVLVLMDLGSALMSAEMATELLVGDDSVLLSEAPLVEGAVAAAAAARGGASLEEVAAEARGALAMKASQLEAEGAAPVAPSTDAAARDAAASEAPSTDAAAPEAPAEEEVRWPVVNEIGLHARPAALVVELASRFDADLRLAKAGRPGQVSARSLTGLMTLGARLGDELVASASGPQAAEALTALEALARDGFGEGVAAAPTGPPRPAATLAPTAAPQPAPAEPPAPGAVLTGIGASAGVAMGAARRLDAGPERPPERESKGPEAERESLDRGRAAARAAIEDDRDRLTARGAAAEAAIFSAHLALLDDAAILEPALAAIERGAPAERAWLDAARQAASTYRALEEPLLRERAADVEDVGRRVVAAILGDGPRRGLSAEGIVIAAELTPADAAALDPRLVRGIATARGTATAHAAILARALSLPAVVALGDSVLAVPEGTELLLDGDAGTVHLEPDEELAVGARERAARTGVRRARARESAREPAVTRDGVRVEVYANLDAPREVARAVELGAEGVGLLRTEFMFLDRPGLPSEGQQLEALAAIARGLGGRPLTVRTLDVGADKPLAGVPAAREANPFLGRRGIRFSLAEPELLASQLRAVVRVASEHPVRLMFPMIATLGELTAALTALEQARSDTGLDPPLETGIMVEVPAAAILAEQFARHVDFFSIGTNDLTQYAMAAERGNETVADLLEGPQPAVLRLVRDTVAGARQHRRAVGVCGELAADPPAAVLLAGLGVTSLSLAPALVPEVKAALRSVRLADAAKAAGEALAAERPDEARRLATELL